MFLPKAKLASNVLNNGIVRPLLREGPGILVQKLRQGERNLELFHVQHDPDQRVVRQVFFHGVVDQNFNRLREARLWRR